MILDPRSMTAVNWMNQMRPFLEQYSKTIFPIIAKKESDWPVWARGVVQNPTFSGYHLPDPRGFTDWRAWAVRFNQCLNG
jgi:hypothetical protein